MNITDSMWEEGDNVTPPEPPRRPKPITREHAEEVAEFWHESTLATVERPVVKWHDLPDDARNELTEVAAKLLDGGWILNLNSDETHAVVECLMEAGVTMDHADAAPVLPQFKRALVDAFGKLAFANGRHYGLTNFDMGIEEDPS